MGESAMPRYPLVLVPGLLGFVRVAGLSYWGGIDARLRWLGAAVYPLRLSALHDNEMLGEQLLARIPALLAASGATRVNLIGHSQGGLAARYAAAKRPDWIASVTAVASPNHGSELADLLRRRLRPGGRYERLLVWFFTGLARSLERLESVAARRRLPVDGLASLSALSSAGMAAFNARYPQGLPRYPGGEGDPRVDGVHYFSWCGILQPQIEQGLRRLDPGHCLCRGLSRLFVREAGQNDGMVGRFSSHLGKVIRSDYPFDHLDIVDQRPGRIALDTDPVELFVEHARRLAALGL